MTALDVASVTQPCRCRPAMSYAVRESKLSLNHKLDRNSDYEGK